MADSNIQSSGPLNGATEVAKNGNGVANGNGAAAQKKEKEPLIKSCDMNDTMKEEAIAVTREAFEKFSLEKDIAAYIKRTFDQKRGATWHCIVGRNFGSFVTHETKHFIYFYMGNCAILLFKTQ